MTRRKALVSMAAAFPAIVVPRLALGAKKTPGTRQKPTTGAQLIPGNTLAPNVFAFLFNEGSGSFAYDLLGKYKLELDADAGAAQYFPMQWGGSTFGSCLVSSNVRDTAELMTRSGAINLDNLLLPTTACSVAVAKKKTDTTNRASAEFGTNSGSGVASSLGCHLPYSDGIVYWDYSTSRLTKSGLTFGDDVWVFIAGPRGMSIWQNGVKVASTATPANAHTNPATVAYLFSGGNGAPANSEADFAQHSFWYMWNYELTDQQAVQVSAQPFSMIQFGSNSLNFFSPSSGARRRTIIV